MQKGIDKNHLGLVLGTFFAVLHAAWAILVASGRGQAYIDWIMPLHFIDNLYTVTSFNTGSALLLIVFAFVGGYITGWLFAAVWNKIEKKK